jgi:hypothetical protein
VVRPATRRGGGWVLPAALVLVGTMAIVLVGRDERSTEPLDPRSDERLGTSAMLAMARELGADARVTDTLPGDDTDVYVVLADLFDAGQRQRFLEWVGDGGTAVVVDPSSESTPAGAGEFSSGAELAGDGPLRCDIDAFEGIDVGTVRPSGGGVLLEVPSTAESCIGTGGRAHVVAIPRGRGTLVAVGGAGLFVNDGLGAGDNAAVVAALLAPSPGTRVDVLRPGPPTGRGERGLLDLVAPNVWAFLAQLAIAFLLLVLWRSRRLGAPVPEAQPVAVAGSELVSAVGSLLDRSGSPDHAASLLRADLRRFLADQLGVPPDAPPDVVAAVAAERVGADRQRIDQVLGPHPVASDAQLVALARQVDAIRQEVLDHV